MGKTSSERPSRNTIDPGVPRGPNMGIPDSAHNADQMRKATIGLQLAAKGLLEEENRDEEREAIKSGKARATQTTAVTTTDTPASDADTSEAKSSGSVAVAEADDDLEDHTLAELREMAAEQDIEGRSGMSKGELVDALRA